MKTFYIKTLGCKVNSYESEYIRNLLLNNDFEEVESNADICIINTCTVTNTADNKCRKMIRSVRRENEACTLVVCGCTAENHREELNDLDIDILIGNKDKSNIVSLIQDFIKTNNKYIYSNV